MLILLVWFHVLSMKTTLCRGNALDSEPFAWLEVPDCDSSAVSAAPPAPSHFSLFTLCSSQACCGCLTLCSDNRCIMSWTDTAPGPGNTRTTSRQQGQRGQKKNFSIQRGEQWKMFPLHFTFVLTLVIYIQEIKGTICNFALLTEGRWHVKLLSLF